MKEIRRVIMGYAWKLAKKQAVKDNCSARECLSWALTRAWDEYKHCENGICFDIHVLCELMDNSKKNEILPLPAVLASLGMLDRKIILSWGRESAHMGDDTEVFFYSTTGDRFQRIEDALNCQRMIYAQCGKMPTLEYAFSGVKKTAEIKYEVREIKTPDGKKIYGVFECGKTGMIDYSPSKSYADRTAKYYTNFMKGVKK